MKPRRLIVMVGPIVLTKVPHTHTHTHTHTLTHTHTHITQEMMDETIDEAFEADDEETQVCVKKTFLNFFFELFKVGRSDGASARRNKKNDTVFLKKLNTDRRGGGTSARRNRNRPQWRTLCSKCWVLWFFTLCFQKWASIIIERKREGGREREREREREGKRERESVCVCVRARL